MKILKTLFLFFSPVLLSHAQENQDVVIKTQQLSDNVYMLTGQGGNIGLSIGYDGVFMIDDQFARLTPKILDAIND